MKEQRKQEMLSWHSAKKEKREMIRGCRREQGMSDENESGESVIKVGRERV